MTRRPRARPPKVRISVDKRKWTTSPLPGLIALVTTLDGRKRVNVAPKSWLTMIAFEPPTLVLGCTLKHRTARNILATKEFVLNFPPSSLAGVTWKALDRGSPRSIDQLGLTPMPSLVVGPPRIAECTAHLECRLVGVRKFRKEEVALFGQIVAASQDRRALRGKAEARYRALGQIFFLESGRYAPLGTPRRARSLHGH